MIRTTKSISYNISFYLPFFVICYFFIFSNLLAKDSKEIEYESIVSDSSILSWDEFKEKYKNIFPLSNIKNTTRFLESTENYYDQLKANDFQDYTTKDRMIFIYLHALIDMIFEKNKDLLSKFDKKNLPKLYHLGWLLNPRDSTLAISDNFIAILISYLFPNFINDAYVAAHLSHEIAHILLNHFEQVQEKRNELEKLYLNQNSNNNTNYKDPTHTHSNDENLERLYNPRGRNDSYYEPVDKFVETHSAYIKLRRKQEIDADILGFIIYLNAGFKAEYYKDSYILDLEWMESNPYSSLSLPYDIKKELGLYLNMSGDNEPYKTSYVDYHQAIVTILKEVLQFRDFEVDGYISKLIEYKKYEDKEDEHPTNLWRFWYLYNKEDNAFLRNNQNFINNSTINTIYLRLDLTNLENLDEIKNFFNKDFSTLDVDYTDSDDPRVYIIQELLEDNSKIKFTLEIDPKDKDTIGHIQNNNTILLKANNIFQISCLILQLSGKPFTDSCTFYFESDESILEAKQQLDNLIKYAFIQDI